MKSKVRYIERNKEIAFMNIRFFVFIIWNSLEIFLSAIVYRSNRSIQAVNGKS